MYNANPTFRRLNFVFWKTKILISFHEKKKHEDEIILVIYVVTSTIYNWSDGGYWEFGKCQKLGPNILWRE